MFDVWKCLELPGERHGLGVEIDHVPGQAECFGRAGPSTSAATQRDASGRPAATARIFIASSTHSAVWRLTLPGTAVSLAR